MGGGELRKGRGGRGWVEGGCVLGARDGAGESGGSDAADGLDQFEGEDGFGDIIIHTGGEAGGASGRADISGHGDDGDVRPRLMAGANAAGGVETVQFRHMTVHEDEVEGAGGKGFKGMEAVGNDLGFKAQLEQESADEDLVGEVVFGDQDPEAGEIGVGSAEAVEVHGAKEVGWGIIEGVGLLEGGEEVGAADGFAQPGMEAEVAKLFGVEGGGEGGEEDEAEVGEGGMGLHQGGELAGVHIPHGLIEEDDGIGLG